MSGAQDLQSLILSCNKDGMDALRRGQSKAAFEQFKYAESILISNQTEGTNTSLLAVTCNNLGCYYKKVGKLHGALSYLRRALKMEADLDTDEVTIAGTHLNICAILSKLEKHDKAVQHAVSALDLINKRVSSTEAERVSQDDYSVLAIAYHNVAVERDFLHEYEKAADAFKQGHQVAKQYLGEDHPLSVSMGKNCDSVLYKKERLTKTAAATKAAFGALPRMKDAGDLFDLRGSSSGGQTGSWDGATTLPSLGSTQPKDAPPPLMPENTMRRDAADWVADAERTFSSSAPSLDIVVKTGRKSPSWKGTSAHALDITLDHPEAMMDIIDADRTGHSLGNTRTLPHDYRPNRMVRGTTRSSRVMRRFARTVYNSTEHRDKVGTEKTALDLRKSEFHVRLAAEKIQRAWRSWYKYVSENGEWMLRTWACATKIEATWRSYHVRRVKKDKAASIIQRRVRGILVRRALRQHKAAITIQRRAVGILTRNALRKLHTTGTKLQAFFRGALGRMKVKAYRHKLTKAVLVMQAGARRFLAKMRVQCLREEKRERDTQLKAASDIQRLLRGRLGRMRHAAAKRQWEEDMRLYNSAARMQAMVRRGNAVARVNGMRTEKLDKMTKAANVVCRMWRGRQSRQRYQAILREFKQQEHRIVVMQRFARGFVVRLRMWREAVRAEEELWGVVEIQRLFRGHLGRERWNSKLGEIVKEQRRHEAATAIQVFWRARVRVRRLRRKVAREEFLRARLRFRSAQRIQALVRGVLVRKVIYARRADRLGASNGIQRVWRGYVMRRNLWDQVRELRACAIQASIRGHLVRNRRFILTTKTICIQTAWRRFRRLPESKRIAAREMRVARRQQATTIQRQFRQHLEADRAVRIKLEALEADVEQVMVEKAQAIEREDFEKAAELKQRQRSLEEQIAYIEGVAAMAIEAVANAMAEVQNKRREECRAQADGIREDLENVKAQKASAVKAEDFILAADLKKRQGDLEAQIAQLEDT
jgi:hypothetical protein